MGGGNYDGEVAREERSTNRALVYSADTEPCRSVQDLAAGAAILIHEATTAQPFPGHTTPRQAGTVAATAQADTYTLGPYPGGSISIPATGKGAPYPSGFGLGSAGGKLAGMTAQVNLTHSFVSDIDLMLVSPQGQGVMLMSDNCLNQSVSGMVLTFRDAAASTLPDTATCASGTYKPSNRTTEIPDTFPDAVTDDPAATLSVFNGIDPTGFWRMYAIDDNSGDSGSISNWSLTFEIEPAEIQIPESGTSGTAGPYPSTKTFETPPGQVISDLQLNLNGFGHESPEDVHAMLADDKGHAVELFADACGSSPLYDIKWTFGDSFPYLAGDSGAFVTGQVLHVNGGQAMY